MAPGTAEGSTHGKRLSSRLVVLIERFVVDYFAGARLCAKRQPQRCGWSATQPRS